MRISVIAATAAAFLGSATFAYAASAVGVIKNIDTAKNLVTLDNGSTYWMSKTMKLSGFKVGEKVDITYSQSKAKMDNGRMEVQSLKPAA